MSNNTNLKKIEYYQTELDRLDKNIRTAVQGAIKKIDSTKTHHKIYQADWYVKGLIYHCRNLSKFYDVVCGEAASRALIKTEGDKGPDIIIMYCPEIQQLHFEFTSLVNLARISLDNLRNVLFPVFKTPYLQLPKSINNFNEESTDCPLYVAISKSEIVQYLIEIRDCIVHYRTFATSDNAKGVREGIIEDPVIKEWPMPLANISFRLLGGKKVATNIFLPDIIFKRDNGHKTMPPFTYDKRINILSQSLQFVKTINDITKEAFNLLIKPGEPTFTYG